MAPSASSGLERVRVADCMHHGIFSCDPEASLAEAAAIMATHRVHAVAVQGLANRPWAILSDAEIVAAIARADGSTAGAIAAPEAPSVPGGCSLREAAQLMGERGVSHLIVRDHSNGHPVGVLSAGDIVGALARTVARRSTPEG